MTELQPAMTEFFAQRIDLARFNTPRPGFGGAATEESWLLLVVAESHSAAALVAYQRWQSQRLGCVGFFDLGDVPLPRDPAWIIKVWDRGEAKVVMTFQVSHEVKTTYTAVEVKP